MKLFKSIKWRLQLWYGLVLVVVLVGFGTTAYQLERGRQFRRLDEDLHRRAGLLVNTLRRPPRGPAWAGPAFDQPPPHRTEDGSEPQPEPLEPGHGNLPATVPFHLPPAAAALFDASDPNGFYFIIRRDGTELARSTNAPAVFPDAFRAGEDLAGVMKDPEPPDGSGKDSASSQRDDLRPEMAGPTSGFAPGQPGPARTRGNFRELVLHDRSPASPFRDTIVVGRNIARELTELHVIGWTLTGVGAVILLLGLTVGGWLVGRALKPVAAIGAAAAKISAGDLSQRINITDTDTELGQLAAILNATFMRLERAFTQQKQFAADAAHELRTPVTVMLTQTQTALNRERDATSYKLTVEACQRAAQRMRRLIESLLELARFDAGQEVLRCQHVDLGATVAAGVELVQPLAAEQGVTISVTAAPLTVTGDGDRLAQVVNNLLTNAIQYNRSGGTVSVKLASQNGLAVLTIADTGQGIAPADLPRVFERFYRTDQARTGGGNAGLGLSICQAIVTAHGGIIEAASETGSGTTFTVRLPLGPAAAPA